MKLRGHVYGLWRRGALGLLGAVLAGSMSATTMAVESPVTTMSQEATTIMPQESATLMPQESATLMSQETTMPQETMLVASEETTTEASAVATDTVKKKKNLIQKIIGYFSESDEQAKANENKPFRFTVVGGPAYSSDTKLQIGLAGLAQYRLPGCEAPLQASSMTLSGMVSTAKFWMIKLAGTTIIDGDRQRLNTEIRLGYAPRDFWGMGYDMGDHDEHGQLKQLEARVLLEWLLRPMTNFYVGPAFHWNYNRSGNIDSLTNALLEGQDHVVRNYGVGFVMQYDSRDLITNASRGLYVYVRQMFRPRFLGNGNYSYSSTEVVTSFYHKAWKDAILAYQLGAQFNYGHPSWAMLALLGGSERMRGYYEGRYRDKNMWYSQIEVRQHLYKRIGVTAWVGGGNVFHDSDSFKHFLPNYGVGFRFELRKRANVRLDYGFGKSGQSGFMFSLNEAF